MRTGDALRAALPLRSHRIIAFWEDWYRCTSLIRKRTPLGPNRRTMPEALWGS